MKFLADENFPPPAVRALRELGLDGVFNQWLESHDCRALRELGLDGVFNQWLESHDCRALRELGLDVAWVCEDSPGPADEDILAGCTRDKLTLVPLWPQH